MEMNRKENIGWIDLLRVVACFLVVLSHSCDPFVAQFDADRSSFLTGVFTGSFVRACVPLFVMMTGVLLLPIRSAATPTMSSFYKKRIGRLVVPLIFWSIALPLLYFVYFNYVAATNNPSTDPDTFTLKTMFVKMYTFIFNFNYDTTPLWYVYMLIGLYLLMPILNVWLKQAEKKDLKLFLYIWGFTLLIPYIKMIAPVLGYMGNWGNMGIFGICDWNDYGTFYYFSGFTGYLVLAYYLVNYPPAWNWTKTLAITVPMFTVGYLITSVGYVITQQYFPGNYAYLEIVWYFAGINVFMMTYAVFVIIQKIKIPSSPKMAKLASLTFGIYLCHFVIVQAVYDVFDKYIAVPYILRIFGIAVIAFAISFALTWLMDKTALTRRFIK